MPEVSGLLVVCMGLGTVFVGLISIIIIVKLMGAILNAIVKDDKKPAAAPVPTPVAAPVAADAGIPNRPEFVAAVAAAIAEDLGTDISKIQIHSIKRI